MANVTIKVEPKMLGRMERKLSAGLRKTRINRALRTASDRVLAMLQAGSIKVYDLGGYRNGWRATVSAGTLTITNGAKHFIFVEKGRGAGKTPPPASAIRSWVLRKGMQAGAAFPIAKAIGRRGVKARPFFFLPATQKRIDQIVQKSLIRWFDKTLMRSAR